MKREKTQRIKMIFAFASLLLISEIGQATEWLSCYNKRHNKMYFNLLESGVPKACNGKLSFKGRFAHHLITDKVGADQFPVAVTGSQTLMEIDNGRQLFITQWKGPSKTNRIVVLEPSLKETQVKKHCEISNALDRYQFRYQAKTRKLFIKTYHRSHPSSRVKPRWKACSI